MIEIRSLEDKDFDAIVEFADEQIGESYFSREDLEKIKSQSQTPKGSSSFIALDGSKIVAIRLTRNNGTKWYLDKVTKDSDWKVDKDDVAYFQSLFIDPKYQGQGLGTKLSNKAIERLKENGAKAVVSHSHVESPNNSSFNYLTKLGFEEVQFFPLYWKNIDYLCTTCGKNPCECSAIEMIKYL